MNTFARSSSALSLSLGFLLISINIFGLFKEIRPRIFFEDDMRFQFDTPKPYIETLKNTKKRINENSDSYANRLTNVISDGVAHINWDRTDPIKYNQLIPVWENYILYIMGKISRIPEYERYHYADYKRSLERGIGICGDASMIMSQILHKNKIKNQIVSYKEHVIVEAKTISDKAYIYDADFGVVINHSVDEIKRNPKLIEIPYSNKNYTKKEIEDLKNIYSGPHIRWGGVEQFITKKYYFEHVAYPLKWLFPIILILLPISFGFYSRNKSKIFLPSPEDQPVSHNLVNNEILKNK